MGQASIYPHGVTIYNPEKCWNGYNLVPLLDQGVLLFDMNGNEVRHWDIHAMPPKLLPGGHLFGNIGKVYEHSPGIHDSIYAVQFDYDGNVVWKCRNVDYCKGEGEESLWASRQHHDIQREGNPVGYYVPNMDAKTTEGTTLILSHEDVLDEKISTIPLMDDLIVEVDWEGNVVWKWRPVEHFEEFGFDDVAKATVYRNPCSHHGEPGDYLHINSASYLGANCWYDQGDMRFNPENIIISCRQPNITAIIDKETGAIVWRLGPDYSTPELKQIRQVIGQHHSHMIPQGLPGAGNILIFDNGGRGGFGAPHADDREGQAIHKRDFSRVIEFNPITFEMVWEFTAQKMGNGRHSGDLFYSSYVSSAQRLPNGNTLIDEGAHGRVIEVTPDFEVVWEWISPYYINEGDGMDNMIYRAYRYPYSYVPQEPTPVETPITPIDKASYRVPGSAPLGGATEIKVNL